MSEVRHCSKCGNKIIPKHIIASYKEDTGVPLYYQKYVCKNYSSFGWLFNDNHDNYSEGVHKPMYFFMGD